MPKKFIIIIALIVLYYLFIVKFLSLSDYRRTEFADKSYKNNTSSTGDHQATESLLEINTNLNKISTRTPEPLTPKLMHYDSAMPSPFIGKKKALKM